MRRLYALGCLALSLSACAVESRAPVDEQIAANQEEIFGGTVDSGNAATVFLYAINGQFVEQCTGTLIKVNGSYGYILTAHHCEGMQYIKFGTNAPQQLNAPDFQVDQDYPHPNYGGQAGDAHDLRILRFQGANPGMTVVPVTTNPDGVTTQTMVDISGYGLTESGDSTTRRHVTMKLSKVNSQFLEVNQTTGKGSCSGDSGGPWYADVNGVKSVVAVTSYGDQNCVQYGDGGRVQLDLSWIQGIIGGTVMETCDSCFASATSDGGACGATIDACFNDQACSDLADCIYNCPANDQACVNTCASASPTGVDKYNAIYDCAICDTCSSLCDTSSCGGTTTTTTNAATTTSTTDAAATTGAGGSAATGGAGGAPADDSTSAGDPADGGNGTKTITTCVACAVGSSNDSDSAVATLACLAGLGIVIARRRRQSSGIRA